MLLLKWYLEEGKLTLPSNAFELSLQDCSCFFPEAYGSREIKGNQFHNFLLGREETFLGRRNRFNKMSKTAITVSWVNAEGDGSIGACLGRWPWVPVTAGVTCAENSSKMTPPWKQHWAGLWAWLDHTLSLCLSLHFENMQFGPSYF